MGTKQPKLKHEYPNLLLKKINVNNPPDVLLLGNGLNIKNFKSAGYKNIIFL